MIMVCGDCGEEFAEPDHTCPPTIVRDAPSRPVVPPQRHDLLMGMSWEAR